MSPLAADDVAVSVLVHQYILAFRKVHRAETALAACDAAAERAGVCVRTLHWASRKALARVIAPIFDDRANAMIRAMETTTFGGVAGCRGPGALSPEGPRLTLTAHPSGEAA